VKHGRPGIGATHSSKIHTSEIRMWEKTMSLNHTAVISISYTTKEI
jgi:hypothetical protein